MRIAFFGRRRSRGLEPHGSAVRMCASQRSAVIGTDSRWVGAAEEGAVEGEAGVPAPDLDAHGLLGRKTFPAFCGSE